MHVIVSFIFKSEFTVGEFIQHHEFEIFNIVLVFCFNTFHVFFVNPVRTFDMILKHAFGGINPFLSALSKFSNRDIKVLVVTLL